MTHSVDPIREQLAEALRNLLIDERMVQAMARHGYLDDAAIAVKAHDAQASSPSIGKQICANCDAEMPKGCGGTFKDEKECAINGGPTYAAPSIGNSEPQGAVRALRDGK